MIRVYDDAGIVIETHEHVNWAVSESGSRRSGTGEFHQSPSESIFLIHSILGQHPKNGVEEIYLARPLRPRRLPGDLFQ